MRSQRTSKSGLRGTGKGGLRVEYTDKPLSGWGGLLPFFTYWNGALSECLEAALPDGRTSNNQVTPPDIVRSLIATVLIGGCRFAHVDRIREDEVIRQITGARRLAGADTVRRYFMGFTPSQNEHLYATLRKATWEILGEQEQEDILDLDSTVLDRFGEQEGVAKGYHPQRRVARSHHPLLGMLAKAKMIVHCWLRSGGASTHRGALEFLDELLASVPGRIRLTAVRADSGFFSKEYLKGFEDRHLRYAVSMKISQPVRRFCQSIAESQWIRFDDDNDVADTTYHPPQWPVGRRVVVVRKKVKSKDRDSMLFDIPIYDYRAIVTDLQLPAIDLVHFYNNRGDCENRIKEFKNDFSARGFCLDSFIGTETVMRLLSIAFNVATAFKTHVLLDATLTLATVRNRIFVVGASIGRSARHTILRLGLRGRWRTEFEKLLKRVRELATSTAAQLANMLTVLAIQPPSPWRARRSKPAML